MTMHNEQKRISLDLTENEVTTLLGTLTDIMGACQMEDVKIVHQEIGNKVLKAAGFDCSFSQACEHKPLWKQIMACGITMAPENN